MTDESLPGPMDPVDPTEPVADAEAGPALPPLWKRLIDVFVSPGTLTEALAAKPAWFAALFLGAVLVVIQTAVIPVEVWEASFRDTMMQQGRELPEGFEMSGNVMRVSGAVGGLIFWFVFTFVMTGVVTLIFSFLMGDEGRYKQYLAMLSHAWFIPALVGLLLVPLKIMQENPQFTLNLGAFFFFVPEGYFSKVLTMIDLSQVWAWLVVAQGARAIHPKRSFGSAAAVLLGLMLVLVLAFAPFAPGG